VVRTFRPFRLLVVAATVALTIPGPAQPAVATPLPTKVLTIVEENHTAGQAVDGMPYLASLGRTYGYTTAYRGNTHPSLPNYLAMAGGSTFGVKDNNPPSYHPLAGPSVFDQAIARGRTAKTYAESMPANCRLTNYGRYAVRHNPWPYFADATSRANCRRFDVPAGTPSGGALRTDVVNGTLPNIGLLIPNLCHDGHDCPMATADSWLRGWLKIIMAGPDYRAGRLAIIVTFDEDDYSADNTVLTTVISPFTHHVVSNESYTHYSWTHYVEQVIGSAALRNAGTARSLRPAFPI
jgi:acid phosphatase